MTIDIKRQLELLLALQEIDVKVRTIDEELENMPEEIAEARSELDEIQGEFSGKEDSKTAKEKEKRELEANIEDLKARLLNREGKLFAIKTNKEYQAALKELTDGKRENRKNEDRVLVLMEEIEQLSSEITQLSGTVADKKTEFATVEIEFKNREEELEKERDSIIGSLEEAEAKVDKELLEKYNYIKTRYMDPMANAFGKTCGGCNMNIPPQMYNELLKGTKIHFCPNCYRFVYIKEIEEKAEEGTSDET